MPYTSTIWCNAESGSTLRLGRTAARASKCNDRTCAARRHRTRRMAVVYNDQPNVFIKTAEKIRKSVNAAYSLGFVVKEDGEFSDVIYGSPAYAAGIGPGMKLIAINGRAWSKDVLQDALRASTESKHPIDLLIENAKFFKTYSIDYHGGIRNPHLERAGGGRCDGRNFEPADEVSARRLRGNQSNRNGRRARATNDGSHAQVR